MRRIPARRSLSQLYLNYGVATEFKCACRPGSGPRTANLGLFLVLIFSASCGVVKAQLDLVERTTRSSNLADTCELDIDSNSYVHATDEIKIISPLPVTRILLYSSGVAQVLHEGEIEGGVLMELPFSGHDVDDVLKSLILDDRTGKKQMIIYQPAPEQESVAAKEHETPLTLSQLLQKYRGELIRFKFDDQSLSGHIVGVENRPQKMEIVETLLMMQETGIRAVPVNQISELNFESETLRKEFSRAFAGLVKARDATRRKVGLKFEGDGKRTIRFSYLLDAPIWRITYRLALGEESSHLQSWAHLDNVFGYDWENVEVVLRSGRPVVFHADLFAPIVAERKSFGTSVFDLPAEATLVMNWFGFDPPFRFGQQAQARNDGAVGGAGGGLGGMVGMGGMGGFGGGEPSDGVSEDGRIDLIRNVITSPDKSIDLTQLILSSQSVDSKLGLLEFKLKQSVSLGAGKSAVLPLWDGNFPTKQVGRYDGGSLLADVDADSVQSWVEIENNSDLPFLMAPVTIFEDGNFIGDAAISPTAPKDTAGIFFATDVGVSVTSQVVKDVSTLKQVRYLGMDQWQILAEKTATVRTLVKNQHQKPKTIDIHRTLPKLSEIEPRPYELLSENCTFRFDLAANSELEETHTLMYPDDVRLKTSELLANTQLMNVLADTVNEKDSNRLTKLKELSAEKVQLNQEIYRLEQHLNGLLRDQLRWADLVKKLEVSPEAQKQYIERITVSEEEISNMKVEQIKIRQRSTANDGEWKLILELE